MVATMDRINALFADAREMHRSALEQLAAGDMRDAAEEAWCATKRATDALVLYRTGAEPETSSRTTSELLALARDYDEVENLVGRYFTRSQVLHGMCFYDGICDEDVPRRIRQTDEYIDDAEQMAGGSLAPVP